MSDRLYLSLWLKNSSPLTILPRFRTLVQTFPFSRLAPQVTFTVRAVSTREAPLLETAFGSAEDLGAIEEAAAPWTTTDVCFELEGAWDLLLKEGEGWKLTPSRVVLLAYGPAFEREQDEDQRIEFGQEGAFLPVPESPPSFRYVQDNIRSLLTLVKNLETALPVSKRQLWSESGGNFAERLAGLT